MVKAWSEYLLNNFNIEDPAYKENPSRVFEIEYSVHKNFEKYLRPYVIPCALFYYDPNLLLFDQNLADRMDFIKGRVLQYFATIYNFDPEHPPEDFDLHEHYQKILKYCYILISADLPKFINMAKEQNRLLFDTNMG